MNKYLRSAAANMNSLRSMGGADVSFSGMSGISGGSKTTRRSRRRKSARKWQGTQAMPRGFMGPIPMFQRRRNITFSSELTLAGSSIKRNVATRMTPLMLIQKKLHASNKNIYEYSFQRDFDSPNQGVFAGQAFTRSHITNAIDEALKNMKMIQGYGALATVIDGDETQPPFELNIEDLFSNSRLYGIKVVIERCSEEHQLVNSSNNTLEFNLEVWSQKYDVPRFRIGTNPAQEQYIPESLEEAIGWINDPNFQVQDAVNDITSEKVLLSRFGQSLGSYSLIKTFFRRRIVKRFILKPGEQRNIRFMNVGPHCVDLRKLSIFKHYKPLSMDWSLTVRGGIVGSNDNSAVSHGSGQFQHIVKTHISSRYCGTAQVPTVRQFTNPLSLILAGDQEQINPETDAPQVYTEG